MWRKLVPLFLFALSFEAGAQSSDSLVREYFRLRGFDRQVEATLQANTDQLLRESQADPKTRPLIEKFLKDRVSFVKIEKDLIAFHQKKFSSTETQQLVQFFKSPIGKKLSQADEEMSQELGEVIGKKLREDPMALQKLIREVTQKSEKKD